MTSTPNEPYTGIARAEARIRLMADEYLRYASEDVQKCVILSGRLRESGNQKPEDLQILFRILHDVKGQGGTFDYQLITSIAEIACNILRNKEVVSLEALVVVEQCSRAMQGILQRRITGCGGEAGKKLIERLVGLSAPHLAVGKS